MDMKKIKSIVESILFAAGDAVKMTKISEIIEIDKKTLKKIIDEMIDEYNFDRRGIHIIQIGDSYQMCSRGEYFEYVSRLAGSKRTQTLSEAALEVLSIIAYRQPVTKAIIESIRGVSCDTSINKLLERNLIKESGRLDVPGRPMLFSVTSEFLRCFGISNLSELPNFESLSKDTEADEFNIADEIYAETKE